MFDPKIAPFRPTKIAQTPRQSRDAGLRFWIVLGETHQHAKPQHAVALLRSCRERPSRRRAAESGDEFAPPKANAHLPLLCREPYSGIIARSEPVGAAR